MSNKLSIRESGLQYIQNGQKTCRPTLLDVLLS
jgi:hypothetical protein